MFFAEIGVVGLAAVSPALRQLVSPGRRDRDVPQTYAEDSVPV